MGRSIRRLVRISFSVRAAFALDEAAGKTAGGVSVLAVIHGQREKIGVRFRVLGAVQAVTRTTDSPERTITAPLACLAIFPVSMREAPAAAEVYFNGMQHV